MRVMILSDFSKALAQMADLGFIGVLMRSLGLTVLLLIAAYVVAFNAVLALVPETLTLFGYSLALPALTFSIGAVIALMFASPFLMFPVAALFVGLFLDRIVDAVERRHYPRLANRDGQPLGAALADGLRFLCLFLLFNGIALILYLMMPPMAPIIFWLVNGLLLGLEYFQTVAVRRLDRQGAKRLRRRNFPEIWLAGTLVAVPLSIPLLNLLIPILAVASFTHMFHRLSAGSKNKV